MLYVIIFVLCIIIIYFSSPQKLQIYQIYLDHLLFRLKESLTKNRCYFSLECSMHTKTLLKIKWVPKQLKSQREREAERNRVWAVVITHLVRTNYTVMAVKQYSQQDIWTSLTACHKTFN